MVDVAALTPYAYRVEGVPPSATTPMPAQRPPRSPYWPYTTRRELEADLRPDMVAVEVRRGTVAGVLVSLAGIVGAKVAKELSVASPAIRWFRADGFGAQVWGRAFPSVGEIWVRNDVPLEKIENVVAHETYHVRHPDRDESFAYAFAERWCERDRGR